MDVFANKLLIRIAKELSWEEASFTQDLETVADAKDITTLIGELGNRLHNV